MKAQQTGSLPFKHCLTSVHVLQVLTRPFKGVCQVCFKSQLIMPRGRKRTQLMRRTRMHLLGHCRDKLMTIGTHKQSAPTEAEHVAPHSQPGACSTPSRQHKQRSRSTPPNRHDDIETHTPRRRLPPPDEL